jgi:hypothetical protein
LKRCTRWKCDEKRKLPLKGKACTKSNGVQTKQFSHPNPILNNIQRVLPFIAQAAEAYGISATEIGYASILGHPLLVISHLVAAAHLLIGMVGIVLGDILRFSIKWALGTTTVMTIAA